MAKKVSKFKKFLFSFFKESAKEIVIAEIKKKLAEEEFKNFIIKSCNESLDLPYLNEEQEAQILEYIYSKGKDTVIEYIETKI